MKESNFRHRYLTKLSQGNQTHDLKYLKMRELQSVWCTTGCVYISKTPPGNAAGKIKWEVDFIFCSFLYFKILQDNIISSHVFFI